VRKGPDMRSRGGVTVTDDERKIRLRVCGRAELKRGRPAVLLSTWNQT